MKEIRSQESIISTWSVQSIEPSVSIILITYNQEKYIEDAIRGILAQITDFKIEVIIHDDNSNDDTSLILNKYKKLYPKIIKLILSDTNKFSKDVVLPFLDSVALASGKYIAICEGDDFWINDYKLQRQKNALDFHKEVNLSIHDAQCKSESGENSGYSFEIYSKKECVLDIEKYSSVIKQFSPTASMFCRRNNLIESLNRLRGAPCLDLYLEFMLGNYGFHYLPEKLSVYRLGSIGSYSQRNSVNIEKSIKFKIATISYFEHLITNNNFVGVTFAKLKLKKLYKNLAYYQSRYDCGSRSEIFKNYRKSLSSSSFSLKEDLLIVFRLFFLSPKKLLDKLRK